MAATRYVVSRESHAQASGRSSALPPVRRLRSLRRHPLPVRKGD
jgi:hypothetical protein